MLCDNSGDILDSGEEDIEVFVDQNIEGTSSNESDLYFDAVIGHIEEIIMDDKFRDLQNQFLDKYWREFEDLDENKFVYMDIFKEYTDTIEQYIDNHLTTHIQGFSMEDFLETLQAKSIQKTEINDEEVEGEIFEMLYTFTDFIRFKQMFLDYRAMKEGTFTDLSAGIYITSVGSNKSLTSSSCETKL